MQQPYLGRQVALLTKHGKQDLLRPILETDLGCHLLHTEHFDTDQLGTFTRDINRCGSQLDAARRKAKIGMELTGARLGIASEGAFGQDPFTSFIAWNTEILLWIDDERGIEITGIAQGPAQSMHREVETLQELKKFAADAKFPEHQLVLRPESKDHPEIYKNISDEHTLVRAYAYARKKSANGLVFVENDLRAFSNPTRQEIIRNATKDLVEKLTSLCPKCTSPGFWIKNIFRVCCAIFVEIKLAWLSLRTGIARLVPMKNRGNFILQHLQIQANVIFAIPKHSQEEFQYCR